MMQKIIERYRISRCIRNAIDTYPDGICFASPGGRPILANKRINEVCNILTGHTIVNAESMWRELNSLALPQEEPELSEILICRLTDSSIWQFRRTQLTVCGGPFIQYEASDITQLYEYQARLRENNRSAVKLHERQRKLLNNIVQNNLEQELLRAKMRIHNEFGQLLIMTRQALTEGKEESSALDLFSSWDGIITDMENATIGAASRESSPQNELICVADLIGCRIDFPGGQPSERTALLLFYAAIREALTNAVRHAGADRLTVSLTEEKIRYHVEISHNGKPASGPVHEGGGLSSLRKRLEQDGATMDYRYDPGVTLVLAIPKKS